MNGGFRSFLAFWIGGASSPSNPTPPVYPTYPNPFMGTVQDATARANPFGGSVDYKRTES